MSTIWAFSAKQASFGTFDTGPESKFAGTGSVTGEKNKQGTFRVVKALALRTRVDGLHKQLDTVMALCPSSPWKRACSLLALVPALT